MLIVIPCYNEYNRLDKNAYTAFLKKNIGVKIIFSNDASSDNTLNLLKEIQSDFRSQVFICDSQINRGKAEAVRHAVLYAFDQQVSFDKIGYIDADLSVSLEECLELSTQLDKKCLFVFGSRISMINNTIRRSNFRHYSGRFVATIISNLLKIEVYDTQCGFKLFDSKLAKIIFQEPFISRWLFDVELFFRMIKLYSREELKEISLELPLKTWVDTGESKVKISYFFKLWQDLYLIKKHYSGV